MMRTSSSTTWAATSGFLQEKVSHTVSVLTTRDPSVSLSDHRTLAHQERCYSVIPDDRVSNHCCAKNSPPSK